MRKISRLLYAVLCAAVFVSVSAGQTVPGSSETKSIVQGKVLQQSGGQGIRKAKVNLRGASAGQKPLNYEAVTDETGQFTFESVEPGRYVVQLERSGFVSDQKSNQNRLVQVIAGQDAKGLVFHMLAAGVISGKIVDLVRVGARLAECRNS